jgi:hypothetical protein
VHFVSIEWGKFLPAVILLLTPVALFEGPQIRFREIDRDWDRHWGQIASHWLHYFDFVRAALGTWLLLASLHPVENAHGFAKYAPLLTQGSIRLLAVVVQAVWCRAPDSINAPFAFVTGLLITGLSPLVATIALALAIPLSAGSRTPAAFFPLLAIGFFAVGFLFGGKALILKISMGALAPVVPWLWALLFQRSMVIPYRSRRGSD